MSALGKLVVSLALEHAQYTQGLDRSSQEALKFAQNSQKSFDQASASVKGFMKGAVGQAAAAVGALVAVNESFTRSLEFSKSIAQISTQINGSIDDLNKLEAAAKGMSVQFGTLPIEQSRAFYEIISSGTSDVTKATELLSAANKLAIGGNTDLATSVDGLTNIMNSYSGKVESADAVSDALFVGMKAGKATMEELSSSLGKVTPIAASLNVSFDELVATVSALSKQGISTTEAVTGVRAILASVAKPTKEAGDLSAALGLQFNAAGLQAKGFAGFLDDVSKKTGGNVDKLALLFGGVEALIPIMALSGQAGQDFTQIMQDMGNKAGSTQDAFDKMAASPGFKIDQLMASISNIAITLGDSLASVLAPAAEKASIAINKLFGIDKNLSAIDQQKQKISELQAELESLNNDKHIPVIGDLIFDKRQADLLEQRIEDGISDLNKLKDAVLNGEQQIAQAVDSGGTKKAIDFQVKLPAAVNASTQAIEKQTKAFDIELRKLKQYESDAKRVREITESVATKQERYNQTLEELNRLRPDMSVEAYTRALDKAERELQDVGAVNRQVTSEMDQLWIQAGRNIQSTFASSIFDAFNDGVDGMWRNAKTAVGRILSEFAALKFSQSIGLSAMFAVPGAASAGGGIGGTGTSALNIASMGSSALGLLKSGFGATSLMSSVGGMLPGSVGSFFGGMGVGGTQAAAQAGASALWGASGASTAASMGASVASFAGPAIAIAAVDQIVRMLAGDKMIGGGVGKVLNFVPVLGPLLNGLFGRGPMKQQGTSLTGEIGAEGFESGALQTRFKMQGGLFRSDKIDFARVDAVSGAIWTDNNKLMDFANDLSNVGKELFGLINDTTKQTSSSLRQIGDDLGISTAGIDKFSHSINLLTEKGEMLTEEQIGQEIEKITDGLARSLLPSIDQYLKSNESAIAGIQRISNEFNALSQSAMNLGASAAYAKDLVNGLGIEQRSAFVDKAGGTDSLLGLTQYFAEKYLTSSEQIAPVITMLGEELGKLGIQYTTDITKDQAKSLIQSNAITGDMRLSLLQLLPSFDLVKDTLDQIAAAAPAASDGLADVTKELASAAREINVRNADDTEYGQRLNKSIADTTAAISELESIANQLMGTVNSINPLSVEQARRIVSSGNLNDPNLQAALSVLGGMGSDGFSSGLDFQRAKGKNAGAVIGLQSIVSGSIAQKGGELSGFIREEELLQQSLAKAASAYSAALPRFASGSSYVPQTGLAMVHQGERIINPQQNQDLVGAIKQQAKEMKDLKISTESLRSLLRNAMEETGSGLALRTAAA